MAYEGMVMIKGFKMKLFPGMEEEYERRHNLLWPEMKDSIHKFGGKNYSIFLDKETLTLFGTIEIEDEEKWRQQADDPINRKLKITGSPVAPVRTLGSMIPYN